LHPAQVVFGVLLAHSQKMAFVITLTPYAGVINVESFIESIELIDIYPVYTLVKLDADGG
jgi:hypothetical protein